MELAYRPRCSLCGVKSSSSMMLYQHVQSPKHRRKLGNMAELGLQYYLDAHLRDQPVLGLEYIVEERGGPSAYRYRCRLCQEETAIPETLHHLLSKRHVERYITRHHVDMMPEVFRSGSYKKTLMGIATAIWQRYGCGEIQVKISQSQADAPPAVPVRRWDESAFHNVFCNLCPALLHVENMEDHFQSEKHRVNLLQAAPEQVQKLGSLRYLLEEHLRDFPLLGLEYVLESRLASGYRYTCMLCYESAGWYQTFLHLIGKGHLSRYIRRHHPDLPLVQGGSLLEDDLHDLREAAIHIYLRDGRKEIELNESGEEVQLSPEGGEDNNLLSALITAEEDLSD